MVAPVVRGTFQKTRADDANGERRANEESRLSPGEALHFVDQFADVAVPELR